MKEVTVREIDRRLARLLVPDGDEILRLVVERAAAATGEGHLCLDLRHLGDDLPAHQIRERLGNLPHVGRPGDYRPLILDRDRLYLYRYWEYECRVAEGLRQRGSRQTPVDRVRVDELLDILFGAERDDPDPQREAARVAAGSPLLVVSGGPGTGKTTTAVRIIALLSALAGRPLRTALAAPTGKAAARLSDAVSRGGGLIPATFPFRDQIPSEATTIHRLLGATPSSFRHNSADPLSIDLLVVDETSMVSVPLMARLLDALPDDARLVLMGDRDQLASVEPGSLMGEISSPPGSGTPLPHAGSIVILSRTYRFGTDSGIGRLARAVMEGDAEGVLELLRSPSVADCSIVDPSRAGVRSALEPLVREGYGSLPFSGEPSRILSDFDRFRILCGVREGEHGVGRANRMVEEILANAGVIHPASPLYHGRGVMVTVNDHHRMLFNGDTGVLLRDREVPGGFSLFFGDGRGGIRKIPALSAPPHETAFAVTIHKSQGSEFDHVVVILPPAGSPILSAELLYTAVTRGKRRVDLIATEQAVRECCRRRITRTSGLWERLWSDGDGG